MHKTKIDWCVKEFRMKAVSIKNPWGYLICVGIKDVENRTWKTNYRGKILIHASKTWDKWFNFDEYELSHFFKVPKDVIDIVINRKIPFGAIIGEAELVDIVTNSPSIWAVPGQYHWILKRQKLYDESIPAKGSLGLWDFLG